MTQNYLSFFDLNDDPFRLTPDTAYFYNSPEHATALLSLEYCVKEKEGFCILTGEPGTGKTTILRIFVEKWKDRAEIALIMTPRLSPEEFFLAILEDFKIPLQSSSKNDMLKAFRDFLLHNAQIGRRVAIIVDEAQELPDTTLEELRLLSNLETEKEKLLQIILIGQPELRTKLGTQSLRQLNQRITVRVQLEPLSAQETADYINTRLIRGGNSSLLYNDKARSLIFELSGGIPRTINLLASRGLMAAFLEESREVSERHVRQGAKDVMATASTVSASGKPPTRRVAAIATGVLLFAVAGWGLYFTLGTQDTPKAAAVQTAAATPVAAQVSSARLANQTTAKASAPVPDSSFTAAVSREIAGADTHKTALDSFNVMAAAWDFPQIVRLAKRGPDVWQYLADMSARRGMELIQFYGTLDGLLELGYPAILQIDPIKNGKEAYTALIGVNNGGYLIPSGLAGKKQLTREELESVWHGRAYVLWKNHKKIPSRIANGAKTHETAALQNLLAQVGVSAGKSGMFDTNTVNALRSFQGSKGLKTTGQPDPQTLFHLYKESAAIYYHPSLK
ncbi:MAG: AAA family ATPase [Deltaproteobacteria bacterium]|nr:AAA family ATPase [Deltaproteobacteria bacterium]